MFHSFMLKNQKNIPLNINRWKDFVKVVYLWPVKQAKRARNTVVFYVIAECIWQIKELVLGYYFWTQILCTKKVDNIFDFVYTTITR